MDLFNENMPLFHKTGPLLFHRQLFLGAEVNLYSLIFLKVNRFSSSPFSK